jgi:hypothetical protein
MPEQRSLRIREAAWFCRTIVRAGLRALGQFTLRKASERSLGSSLGQLNSPETYAELREASPTARQSLRSAVGGCAARQHFLRHG